MRGLNEREILDVWETGGGRHAIDRALAVLAATMEDPVAEPLADLPIAVRDRHLLESRAVLFGPELATVADCGACGETMEFSLAIDQLLGPPPADEPVVVRHGGLRLAIRHPTSRDLAEVAHERGEDAARHLVERLVVSAENDDGEPARPALSDAVITAAGEALRVAAPNSEIMLDFACPHCGETSVLLFDPLTHVWSEIEVAARRALLDVHGLASAYGWTESEILALSPARRRHYLELAGE